ncbi:MAG: hypothetical protein CVV07_07335 [Gammaproteobacteria bacterium HGW-Gammaproteobacteria-11]|nr:MAG: hypothetical protein CVV07_07335 [Gammaproteobacteria bacterium HGW-Gammaproteobacteria-11]
MKIKARDVVADIGGLAGAALLAYGAWLIYNPAGFIVMGLLLLAFAWLLGGVRDEPALPDEEQS